MLDTHSLPGSKPKNTVGCTIQVCVMQLVTFTWEGIPSSAFLRMYNCGQTTQDGTIRVPSLIVAQSFLLCSVLIFSTMHSYCLLCLNLNLGKRWSTTLWTTECPDLFWAGHPSSRVGDQFVQWVQKDWPLPSSFLFPLSNNNLETRPNPPSQISGATLSSPSSSTQASITKTPQTGELNQCLFLTVLEALRSRWQCDRVLVKGVDCHHWL